MQEYHRKRDFRLTPEPRGEATASPSGRSFVVQKHAASRLHYDFRLEMEGVLRSWSVPKGPSLDPRHKRLAVQTEDHPVSYGDFEGVIPKGEYGGGTVLVWDRGTWDPVGDPEAGYRKGALKFVLHGAKLRGRFILARMGGEWGDRNWLLMKDKDDEARSGLDIAAARPNSVLTGRGLDEIATERDQVWRSSRVPRPPARPRRRAPLAPEALRPEAIPGARPQSRPRFVAPQLATLVDTAPEGKEWLHEMKLDGYRILAVLDQGRARLVSRNGKDWTVPLLPLATALESLGLHRALLDGEAAAVLPDGTTRFQVLQNAMSGGDGATLAYFAFDLLHLDGYDLRAAPLESRKAMLQQLLAGADAGSAVRYCPHVDGFGSQFHRAACELGLEGIVSKRRDAAYASGRSREWLKVKCLQEQEVVIGGMTSPAGSRVGLGALLVGVHDAEGRLRYAGKVGTGFTDSSLRELQGRLRGLAQGQSPFADRVPGQAGVLWAKPELVAEVAFTEWTDDGRLRHPSFRGLREDKLPRDVVRERAARLPPQAGRTSRAKSSAGKAFKTSPRRTQPRRAMSTP